MGIFDQLTQGFDQRRQADSIANTVLPFIGGAPQRQQGGTVLDQLLGRFGGGQQAAPAAPQPTAGGALSQLIAPPQAIAPANLQSFAPSPPSGGLVQSGNVVQSAKSYQNDPTRGSQLSAPAAPSFAPAPVGPLPTFAAGAGVPNGQDNAAKAMAFYQAKGLSPLAASALVGGFHAESGAGLNTRATNVGDGSDGSNSIGIPQWNGDRARGFLNYARANNLDPASLDAQLQYSWLELNGSEKGTLQALMNPNLNPGTATAAALGYERPEGWTAQNPYGAKTFGSRLKNTLGLARGGFTAPFDGSPIGPNPNTFTPDPSQGGALPTFAVSGQGMQLSPATPMPNIGAGGAVAPRGGGGYAARSAGGQTVQTDADGNALGSDGQPTTLAFGGVPVGAAGAPASRAILSAAPIGADPLVTVPGYSGQWNQARIAAAPDGTDVPDDGELARAQSGSLGGATRESVAFPDRAPGTANALSPAAPYAQQPAPAAAPMQAAPQGSAGGVTLTMPMIAALVKNADTQGFGLQLLQHALTTKSEPLIADGYVIDRATGRPLFALPQRPQQTDAIKNFQFGQSNPAFAQYQADQQRGDKAQLVEMPLPNGQFQKAWATPGQIPSPSSYVGAPYTRQAPNQVNIDQKAESAQEGEVGKSIGQEIGDTLKAGASAPQALNTIRMMRAAAASGGDNLSTGPFGQSMLKAKQAIGNALNIEIPGTSEGEVLNNLGYGLATQAARAISNRPTQFEFGQALAVKPGLAQSKDGFQALLNIRQQDLEDQLALGKLASVRANRDNWLAVKAQYYAEHPVMSPFDPSKPLGAGDVQAINGSQQQAAPSTISSQDASALPVVSSPEAAARLKPGTLFKTPDGRIKQR